MAGQQLSQLLESWPFSIVDCSSLAKARCFVTRRRVMRAHEWLVIFAALAHRKSPTRTHQDQTRHVAVLELRMQLFPQYEIDALLAGLVDALAELHRSAGKATRHERPCSAGVHPVEVRLLQVQMPRQGDGCLSTRVPPALADRFHEVRRCGRTLLDMPRMFPSWRFWFCSTCCRCLYWAHSAGKSLDRASYSAQPSMQW